MQRILPYILATLTQHNRQKVENIEFVQGQWAYNAFRLWELLFWRREGIRIEQMSDINGSYSYTWENLLVTYEGLARAFLQEKRPKFSIVYLPQLQLAGLTQGGITPFRFAIAFDAADGVGGSSVSTISFNHTSSGSNTFMVGGCYCGPTHTVSANTYNSVSLTATTSSTTGSFWKTFLNVLIAPSTGTHTFSFTASASDELRANCATYSGCKQTAQPDSFAENHSTGATTTLTWTTTVVTSNCWLVLCNFIDPGSAGAGSGTFKRFSSSSVNTDVYDIFDSNGTVSTGSQSLIVTFPSSNVISGVVVSVAPVAAAVVVSGFFFAASR